MKQSRTLIGAAFLAALFAGGCAEAEPTRFQISGTASVGGNPIPHGEILFTPDGARQNAGPQGIATIRDGRFDTAVDGKGIAGGPTVVRVTGFTKPGGKLLCEHELHVDLPRAKSTENFDVPPKAAPKDSPRTDI